MQQQNNSDRPFRVLSLDGGGVRGLFTAVLLRGLTVEFAKQQGLDTQQEYDLGRQFDLIVGTSTGAILAAALAAGVPLSKVIGLYTEHAKSIFTSPVPGNSVGALLLWMGRHLNRAANHPQPLEEALRDAFGDETLGQLYARRRIGLLVPAVDAETLKSWGFKTPHVSRLQRDVHYRLVDVCMASAAAPLVFPVKEVQRPDRSGALAAPRVNWFVDGGLWANNPAVVALTEALTTAKPGQRIQIVSASTCPPFKGTTVTRDTASRGLFAWRAGIKVVETALDAQSYAYDYVAKTLAQHAKQPVDYIRLADPDVGAEDLPFLGMDNPSDETLRRLTALAYRAVDKNRSEAATGSAPMAVLLDVFAGLKPISTSSTQGAPRD